MAAGAAAIGARIAELRASPFNKMALQVEQETSRLEGRAEAAEIGRLVTEARLLPMQDLLCMGLLDPARLLAQTDPARRIVTRIDALDDLQYGPRVEQNVLDLLQRLPEIPGNLKFVISSRHDSSSRLLLERRDTRHLPLDTDGGNNRADLQDYVAVNLTTKPIAEALAAAGTDNGVFTDRWLANAVGNFLYLKSDLQAIHADAAEPDRLHRPMRSTRPRRWPPVLRVWRRLTAV